MADVQKELQKLKALINQRPTTAFFSNKSNESDKVANGDAEFYINDMSKKFVFTRAGITNPISIDPKNKSIENLEYINDTKVEDLTNNVQSITELREQVNIHENRVSELEGDMDVCESDIANLETLTANHTVRILGLETSDADKEIRIKNLEDKTEQISKDIVGNLINSLGPSDETLPVEYTYVRDTVNNNIKITFEPPISADNLSFGNYNFVRVRENKIPFQSTYFRVIKTQTETGYTLNLQGATFENGVYTIPYSSSCREVDVYTDYIRKPGYELSDDRLTTGIIYTTAPILKDNTIVKLEDVEEPLEVQCIYYDDSGTLDIVFNPRPSLDNFREGTHDFAEIVMSDGTVYNITYNKYKNEAGTYVISFNHGYLEWDKYRWPRTEDNAIPTSITLQHAFITAKSKYNLRDNDFTNAIYNSTEPILRERTFMPTYTEEPLDVSFTFSNSRIGYLIIYFTPAIDASNFREGEHDFLQFTLSDGTVHELTYRKTKNEHGAYILYINNGTLEYGQYTFEHGSDAEITQVIMKTDFITRKYSNKLRDNDFTNAIITSTEPILKDHMIVKIEDIIKPISITYNYTESTDQITKIIFTPAININNFKPGQHDFIQIALSNNEFWGIGYNKYLNDNGVYVLEFTKGFLRDGVYRFPHARSANTIGITLKTSFINVEPVYNLRDNNLTNAIYNTTLPLLKDNTIVNTSEAGSQPVYKLRDETLTDAIINTIEPKIMNNLIALKTRRVPYTSYNTLKFESAYSVGWVQITFIPAITIANLKEGTNRLFQIQLSNYDEISVGVETFYIGYTKSGSTITWDTSDCDYTNGVFTWWHKRPDTYELFDYKVYTDCIETEIPIEELGESILKTAIINLIYPIGSLYTSFDSLSPKNRFNIGTWTQITDRFLYCANSSGQTGGSKKITTANMPPHIHDIRNLYDD